MDKWLGHNNLYNWSYLLPRYTHTALEKQGYTAEEILYSEFKVEGNRASRTIFWSMPFVGCASSLSWKKPGNNYKWLLDRGHVGAGTPNAGSVARTFSPRPYPQPWWFWLRMSYEKGIFDWYCIWLWTQIKSPISICTWNYFNTLALLSAANVMQAESIGMSLHLQSMPDGSLRKIRTRSLPANNEQCFPLGPVPQ